MKNRFVFDTNTLISAALSPHSTNANAIQKALELGIVVYSDATWSEFLNVLFRSKFDRYFTIMEREEIADRFQSIFEHQSVDIVIAECRDFKDNMFLELAVACGASALISGDPDLLVLHPFRGIPVLNAANFLRELE